MAASTADGKWRKCHTCLLRHFTYSFQSLLSTFIDLTCTRQFYIQLFEKKKKTLKFFKTSSVLISSLAPSSTGKMTTHLANLCAERARGGAFMPHDTLTYNSEHSESKYWPRFNAFSSCGFYIFVFCRSIT